MNDQWKRCGIGASALSILGFGYDDMVTVGREPPHYGGAYAGEVSDEVLSDLYNSADYLVFPSSVNEGLGLPPCEAMACGCIPILCNDLSTREEFFPSSVFPEYDANTPDAPALARFVARFMQDNGAKAEMSERLYRHYANQWAYRLSPRGVAEAIVAVYRGL